ncbi:MAG TPA: MXAN_5187 C-terminal domain-containing protein [Blastocatellia bacterium]|nr:MXAN_5187 C-terminal domain-containing protein [Blastocatellia bacterium]
MDSTKQANPIDEELDRLEYEMRRLKIEFDIFFNGGTARPPADTKGRVETTIKRLYDTRNISFSQRFRYNSLVARYNVMRELWRRQTQEREENGRPPTAEASVALRDRLPAVRFRDVQNEPEKISELYDTLVAAKRKCGERVGGLTLEAFTTFLKGRAAEIKRELATDAVEFVVGVDNGHVRFTARAAADKKKPR